MERVDDRAMLALINAISRLGSSSFRWRVADRWLSITAGSTTWRLMPVWIGEGFPRDVRAAEVLRKQVSPGGARPIAVARTMSTGAKSALAEDGISWADETGGLDVRVDPGLVLVSRSTELGKGAKPESQRSWTASVGAVAEYVLRVAAMDSRKGLAELPSVDQMADQVGWSPPTVSAALRKFDREGWTVKNGPQRGPSATRQVAEPGALLDRWSAWYRGRTVPSIFAHTRTPAVEEIARDIEQVLPIRTWAVTGWLGLEVVVPFATRTPDLACYVDPPLFDSTLRSMLPTMGLTDLGTREGGRVRFLRPANLTELGARRLEGRWVVSDVRLYGDLLRSGVRGEAGADHLREERLGF